MLTLRQTKVEETTLDTPEAIADHVHAEFARRQGAAPFQNGDRVRIANRAGIPPEFIVGDVGTVMLCDPEFSPLTTLMGVNSSGMTT
ncbi:hypothetical protein MMMDOFMJ_3156 [Methylobacterium gnaphalii]|uniref:Uncharacterized protein n=2 Tax=Methylobacterium gnaphalii TaxID=1010610 RepID=A0A512JNA2_9HYPH|nr:hypothetical protein MGN01_32850 [Methylobacterium gnaphalii]GJD70214.1 hypothetical protein MMMDOFMJ_3156 [Methylobacterium gnaphalii]GLS50549.1 hypothetical protein GCM10007885_34010 [Methylobacterium gnaphalii]